MLIYFKKILLSTSLEAVLKILLGFKVEAGPNVQPQEYSKYFED
jgi:hypothetical protein